MINSFYIIMLLPFPWLSLNARQVWVSLPLFLGKLGLGMGFGFTSTFLAAIKAPHSDIKMDIHTSSWFVSLFAIATSIGHAVSSLAMARLGRRKATLISSVPGIVGHLLTYFAADVPALMVGRVLAGISGGSLSLIGGVAIGEYVSPKNRGTLLNSATAALNVGSLLVHAVGYYTNWRTLAIISTVPLFLSLIIAFTSPESPVWLAEKKQDENSREAFYWLRGKSEDSTREIEELIRTQQQNALDKPFKEIVKDFFLKFKKNNFLKPLGISVLGLVLLEAGGRHIFPSYAGELLSEMMPAGVDPYYYNIVIDVLIAVSGFTGAYMLRVIKMRTMLFSTGGAAVAVLTLACLSLYLVKNELIPETYSLLSVVLFGLFVISASSGCTCIPVALAGELFPLEHKAVMSFLYHIISAALSAVFLKIMPYMITALYIYGALLVLAVCLCIALVVTYYILPETSNKTLQEIEAYFEEKQRS